MLLKLAEGTEFTFEGPSDSGASGSLKKGKVWLRGQRKGEPFQVQTPTATAAIRGTEWYMEVGMDGTTTVGVLDGKVEVGNELGTVRLGAREVALVQPGKTPVKMACLTPDNAVNWTLNYRGLWDEADLKRAGPELGPMIRKAVGSFYRNDLEGAYKILNQARISHDGKPAWLALAGFLELVSGHDAEARGYFGQAANGDPRWALGSVFSTGTAWRRGLKPWSRPR